MENLVGSGTTRRLISNQYLHSNTNNFIASVRNQRNYLKYDQHNKELINLKDRLVNMIKQTNYYVNLFYQDMGIVQRDNFSEESGYKPNGANAFSREYLIYSFKKVDLSKDRKDEKILLTIINSEQSKRKLREIYQIVEKQMNALNVEWDEEQKKIVKNLLELTGTRLGKKIDNMTIANVESWLSRVFVKNRKAGTRGIKLKSDLNTKTYRENEAFQEILKELKIPMENFSIREKESLQQLRAALNQRLKDKKLYQEIGIRYADWILDTYHKKTGKTMKWEPQKKSRFVNLFVSTVSNYTNLDFVVKNDSGLNGFLLEFGMFVSFNLPRSRDNEIVKILGQDQVVREYAASSFRMGQYKTNEVKVVGQSASDISFQGKNNRVYNFQLKNSLNEGQAALTFRAQPEIKVSTYLPTAIQNDKNLLEILQYLLINTAFLKQYGLGKYSSTGSNNFLFKSGNIPKEVNDYILFFLQQTYEFLLGTQYDKNIKEFGAKNAGNLAYIFQGKYFIPIAAYLYSAYEMLNKILKNNYRMKNTTYQLGGIGGISNIPNFKNVDIGINNRTFQREKIEKILPHAKTINKTEKGYKYPEPLLAYGGYYGRRLYNNLKFERINITLIIENLETFFKR